MPNVWPDDRLAHRGPRVHETRDGSPSDRVRELVAAALEPVVTRPQSTPVSAALVSARFQGIECPSSAESGRERRDLRAEPAV